MSFMGQPLRTDGPRIYLSSSFSSSEINSQRYRISCRLLVHVMIYKRFSTAVLLLLGCTALNGDGDRTGQKSVERSKSRLVAVFTRRLLVRMISIAKQHKPRPGWNFNPLKMVLDLHCHWSPSILLQPPLDNTKLRTQFPTATVDQIDAICWTCWV